MPFNDIELKRIKKIVGGFCTDRIPDHARSQVKLLYELRGFEVKLSEARPFRGSHVWTERPVARLKYNPETIRWQLYFRTPSERWRLYPSAEPTNNLKALVDLIREDPFHLFWC